MIEATMAVLVMVAMILGLACHALYRSRERYKNALTAALRRVTELSAAQAAEQKELTPRKKVAQDVPKRFSGAQLRRMAGQINANDGPDLRTNSEILQEAQNG